MRQGSQDRYSRHLGFIVVTTSVFVAFSATTSFAQQVTLLPGTSLQVALDKPVRIHPGAGVSGVLTAPIFLIDHEVLAPGTRITGAIVSTHMDTRKERIRRLLAADFTPPRLPDVVFDRLILPAGADGATVWVDIKAPAVRTESSVLTLGTKAQKRSLKRQAADAMGQANQSVKDAFHDHHYREIIAKWAVQQLPYHPEILWSKTNFNADLTESVEISDTPHPTAPRQDLEGHLPEGTLSARLATTLTSETAKRGDPVEAIVTEPLFSADKQTMLVPEGTRMYGKVMQAKPARRWGRNGSLRFTFTKLDLPSSTLTPQPFEIHGRLSASETAPGEHITMDEEGEVKASGGPEKLVEPALLAVLAAGAAPDGDHPGTTSAPGASAYASNGFGLIARVVSLSTRNTGVIEGFAYYSLAKSVYYRFIDKGHETTFPSDTRVQVTLSER